MPIYEYRCEACQKRFEKLQKVSDSPCRKCPTCGGPLRKVLSPPALQFKGQGFYITDYAKKSPSGAEAKLDSDGESKGKKPAEKKAEARPKAEPMPADKPCSD
jgi:putative FmdB family regulatory protein